MPNTLGRRERLRRRAEFKRVYETGVRIRGRFMTLIGVQNWGDLSRLGVATTRKFGSASRRNRAKRLARELFRLNKPQSSLDLIVVPGREFLETGFAVLRADYDTALTRPVRWAGRSRN